VRNRVVVVMWVCSLACFSAPGRSEDADALSVARGFLSGAMTGGVIEAVQAAGRNDDVLGRLVHTVRARVRFPEAQEWDATVEVHATRRYVTCYFAYVSDQEAPTQVAPIGREDAIRIASELAQAHFPNWGENLGLVFADRRPGSGATHPGYHCVWVGRHDGIKSGDELEIVLAANGRVAFYFCNAAVPHAAESVRITQQRALSVAGTFIAGRATFSMDQVTLTADLVLSHPLAPEEGPIWDVLARRPPPAEGWQERRLRLCVGAVSGRPFELPDSRLSAHYFYGD